MNILILQHAAVAVRDRQQLPCLIEARAAVDYLGRGGIAPGRGGGEAGGDRDNNQALAG